MHNNRLIKYVDCEIIFIFFFLQTVLKQNQLLINDRNLVKEGGKEIFERRKEIKI